MSSAYSALGRLQYFHRVLAECVPLKGPRRLADSKFWILWDPMGLQADRVAIQGDRTVIKVSSRVLTPIVDVPEIARHLIDPLRMLHDRSEFKDTFSCVIGVTQEHQDERVEVEAETAVFGDFLRFSGSGRCYSE